MKLSKTIFALVLFLLVFLPACGGGETGGPEVEEPIKITVQLMPYFSFAPLYIAEEEGYFAEQGLEVEFVRFFTDEALVGLVNGDIDVAVLMVSTGMFNIIAQEGGIMVVADKGYVAPEGCTVNGIIARKDLVDSGELDDVSRLAGKVIAIKPLTIEGFFMDKVLEGSGVALEDLDDVEMGSPVTEMEAFGTGALDLSATGEPWITRINLGGNTVTWRDYKDLIPDAQYAVFIFGPSFLEENPEAGRRFIVAYLKAVEQYNQGKTERNMELLQAFTELEPELLDQICWPTFRIDGAINAESMIEFQEWAVEKGYLDEVLSVDEFWDPSFIEYANQVLGE